MLSRAVSALVVAALAGPALAEPAIHFSMMSSRGLLDLGRRDDDAAYAPTTTFCGMGTTCAEACGQGYQMCGKNSQQTRCYNPAAGETCCAEGLSCENGYYCSAKGDMCLPGEAPSALAAPYVAAAMTTLTAVVNTTPIAISGTSSVVSSRSLATTSAFSSVSVLSVAGGSASLGSANTEDCTQTTAVVVVPTPIITNATATAQAGPTGGSSSQAIETTLTYTSPSLPASATSATAPSVVPASVANGSQGHVLAILLGAAAISAMVL